MGRKRDRDSSVVTSTDVARLAQVSQSTVSRAFNNDSLLLPQTREKVLAAARQLGYRPNAIARSLVSQRTNMVGVVEMKNSSPFHNHLLTLLSAAFGERGYQMMMISQLNGENPMKTVSRALEYRLDGILITAIENSREICELCLKSNVPVVLLSRYLTDADIASVCCDNFSAGRMVADYLRAKGCRTVACLMGKKDAVTTQERLRGLRSLPKQDLEIVFAEFGEYTYRSGEEMAELLLEKCARLPDAIFCSGDIIAFGAMDALRYKYGYRIPEDVSVIGFDNIPESAWLTYNLTTVSQPVNAMVDAACDLLLNRIMGKEGAVRQVMHACTMCERGTVK